jgi:hypothetical protein
MVPTLSPHVFSSQICHHWSRSTAACLLSNDEDMAEALDAVDLLLDDEDME